MNRDAGDAQRTADAAPLGRRKPFVAPELMVYGDAAALTKAFGRRGMHDGVPFGLTKTG
jgi:flavin-dependent dehydrogenase